MRSRRQWWSGNCSGTGDAFASPAEAEPFIDKEKLFKPGGTDVYNRQT